MMSTKNCSLPLASLSELLLRGEGRAGSNATKLGIDVATDAGRGFRGVFVSLNLTPPPGTTDDADPVDDPLSVMTLLGREGSCPMAARKDLRPSGIVLRAELSQNQARHRTQGEGKEIMGNQHSIRCTAHL